MLMGIGLLGAKLYSPPLCIGATCCVTVSFGTRMKAEAPTLRAAELLLLADKAEEVRLIQTAADDSRLNVVEACASVLKFLRRESEYAECPRPHLILLNLDLAIGEHCETLRDIKKDPSLRRIPLVVLMGGAGAAHAQLAYELRANACVVKPSNSEEFVHAIRTTLTFWLTLARLPGD
jgi:two-component system, chemotaxis family, response regulator Rcp1